MNTTERQHWLQQRQTGIGGSDAAVVLGLSQWKTPLQLWQEKTGQTALSDIDSPAMHWGRTLEGVIRTHYEKETGTIVSQPEMLRHPQHEWMIANVDGFTNQGKILEIKTARTANGWGDIGTAEIPDAYALQVQHYMAVMESPAADVAVLIGGSDFRIYTVAADTELQKCLIEAESAFWEMVKNKEPPEPRSFAEIQALALTKNYQRRIKCGVDMQDVWEELIQLRHEIKDAQDKEERCKLEIAKFLYDAHGDTLIDQNGLVLASYKPTKGAMRFDSKTFAAEHPEIYAKYLKQSAPTMRLSIKE